MLKSLQVRLQQYVNREIPVVQAGFQRGRGTRVQFANICCIMKKARKFKEKKICFIDYVKVFDYVDPNKQWNILKEMGVPEYFMCLLRNVYVG